MSKIIVASFLSCVDPSRPYASAATAGGRPLGHEEGQRTELACLLATLQSLGRPLKRPGRSFLHYCSSGGSAWNNAVGSSLTEDGTAAEEEEEEEDFIRGVEREVKARIKLESIRCVFINIAETFLDFPAPDKV